MQAMDGTDYRASTAEYVAKAQTRCAELASTLPKSISIQALGVWSKAPYKALCVNAALGHRMLDLVPTAIEAIEKERWASAATLARSAMETCALSWDLLQTMEARHTISAEDLHDKLDRLLLGHKDKNLEGREAVNVLTTVNKISKTYTGFDRSYFGLCEVAHPNWSGVLNLFASTKYEDFTTNFGAKPLGTTAYVSSIALATSTAIIARTTQKTQKAVDIWRAELPPLTGPRPPDPGH